MVRIQRTKKNQHFITINRRLIEAMDLDKGVSVKWVISKDGNLKLIRKR